MCLSQHMCNVSNQASQRTECETGAEIDPPSENEQKECLLGDMDKTEVKPESWRRKSLPELAVLPGVP